MKKILVVTFCVLALTVGTVHTNAGETDTPRPLVEAYSSLADTILAAKTTEWNLVHSILGATYTHAEGVVGRAMELLAAGKDATAQVEMLAALVAQMGNEGDASVAAVRKRLLEGGHHHNAQGEEQGQYEEGFVIITRESKKAFLAAATRIGKLGSSASLDALKAEWATVQSEFGKLHPKTPMGK